MAYVIKKHLANRANYGGKRDTLKIKYLIIHYTSNDGDSDEANGSYFARRIVKASAHYFIDDDSVTCSVPDDYVAYSVGGKCQSNHHPMYQVITNTNSISIEMCDTKKDGKVEITNQTLENVYAFSRLLMKKYNIPTAGYENFDSDEAALAYLETAKFPIVLKADGLALGKGVLICNTLEEAKDGVKTIMEDKKFGDAGNRMVIEEFMTGREVSVLAFCDGKTIKCMTSAQDHKRAKDGDQGLNTGGMGTFSPSPFYTKEVEEFCEKYIYQPTMDAMAAEGRPFVGILFTGLMLTEDGPKVLEYNARFGDPEAQVVLPRMTNDIIDVMEACIDGRLDEIDLQFEDNAAVCVVLASDGYPVSYKKGYVINGLDEFKKHDGYYCFHAGTKRTDEGIVTNGGRVLGVTAKGSDLKEARKNAYAATEWVTFENKYMRHDIGKAIDDVEA